MIPACRVVVSEPPVIKHLAALFICACCRWRGQPPEEFFRKSQAANVTSARKQ